MSGSWRRFFLQIMYVFRICLQALQQRLVFEPLLEHQEQYSEDAVQPIDREDAVALTELLDKSLPVGSIQVNFGCLLTDKVNSVLPLDGRSQPGGFQRSSALFWAGLKPFLPSLPLPRTWQGQLSTARTAALNAVLNSPKGWQV